MAAIGIYRTSDATKAMNDNLQSLVARGLLDPKNPREWAAANNYAAKSVEDLSDQAKVAAAALPQFQSALNEIGSSRKQLDSLLNESRSVNSAFFVEFGQNLRNGENAWGSFKTAGLDALGKIADKLMQISADKLWSPAFGGSTGGGGLLSLFGLGGGSGSVPVMSSGLGAGTGGLSFPMFAGGTDSAPGGLAIVGERGPELVNLPRGAQVFNNTQSRGMMAGAGGSSSSVTIVQHNDFRGSDASSEARIRQYVDASNERTRKQIVQDIASIKSTSPGYLQAKR